VGTSTIASAPVQVYSSVYVTTGCYVANYIRNRLLTTTMSFNGGAAKTLVTNQYGKSAAGQPGCATGPTQPYG
jgi:hypothetical protein